MYLFEALANLNPISKCTSYPITFFFLRFFWWISINDLARLPDFYDRSKREDITTGEKRFAAIEMLETSTYIKLFCSFTHFLIVLNLDRIA